MLTSSEGTAIAIYNLLYRTLIFILSYVVEWNFVNCLDFEGQCGSSDAEFIKNNYVSLLKKVYKGTFQHMIISLDSCCLTVSGNLTSILA